MIAYVTILPPQKRKDVLEEIAKFVVPETVTRSESVTFDVPNLLQSIFLNSILSEVLRLEFGSLSVRGVTQDTTLTVNGTTYAIEKDSIVFIAMSGVHKNPAIYPDPYTFQPERFIQFHEQKSNPDVSCFYKDGVPLKHPLMPWGGGHFMV